MTIYSVAFTRSCFRKERDLFYFSRIFIVAIVESPLSLLVLYCEDKQERPVQTVETDQVISVHYLNLLIIVHHHSQWVEQTKHLRQSVIV